MDAQIFDDLIGIAEIATVFIGFAVLISVLAPNRLDRIYVTGIVVGASVTILGCIVPIVLRTFLDEVQTIVRISAIFFVLFNVFATRQLFSHAGATEEFKNRSKGFYVIWGLEAVMYIAFTICIIGLWPGYAASFYYAGILFLVIQMVYMFVRLAVSIASPDTSETG